jgi:glycosyltransferase involved in cell wall biosynthesis
VHDATAHQGEVFYIKFLNRKKIMQNASLLFTLSNYVKADLLGQGFGAGVQRIIKLWHPPLHFGKMAPPLAHNGRPRLLCFGRLLPYKGLDLLADALTLLGPDLPFDVRICGTGPKSRVLTRLQALPQVEVENRWIPESDLHGLIEWADGIVLPYRQASQSGVAAAAIAQGRYLLATNIGGLSEQLFGEPRVILCEPVGSAIAEGLKKLFQTKITVQPAGLKTDWNSLAKAILEPVRDLQQRNGVGA